MRIGSLVNGHKLFVSPRRSMALSARTSRYDGTYDLTTMGSTGWGDSSKDVTG